MINVENNEKIFEKRCTYLKLICMDIDGVLTDGGIYIDNNGNQSIRFDVKDGMAIRLLQKYNFKIAWISGGDREAIIKRAQSLDIQYVKTKVKNKLLAIKEIQEELNLSKLETAFLGDDINDLPVIPIVGMFLTPSDAHYACKEKACWVGMKPGGKGFLREFTDKLISSLQINPLEPFETSN